MREASSGCHVDTLFNYRRTKLHDLIAAISKFGMPRAVVLDSGGYEHLMPEQASTRPYKDRLLCVVDPISMTRSEMEDAIEKACLDRGIPPPVRGTKRLGQQLCPSQDRILEFLRASDEPLTTRAIASELHARFDSVKNALYKLRDHGKVIAESVRDTGKRPEGIGNSMTIWRVADGND